MRGAIYRPKIRFYIEKMYKYSVKMSLVEMFLNFCPDLALKKKDSSTYELDTLRGADLKVCGKLA